MIGLIDVDGKLPNLALMKISTFYKSQEQSVEWDEDEAAYVVRGPRVNANLSEYVYDDIYVIGNKYDTPEILGGTGK